MTAVQLRPAAGAMAVRAALRDAVDTLPAAVRPVLGYHFGWLDRHGDPTDAPAGKAMRPAFVLAAAAAVGTGGADAVPGAVAVELVHNFSLLHDDVMDGDLTRRHRPTAWAVFGSGAAILAGDAALTLALDLLGASPSAGRMVAGAVQELVEGQLADLAFEHRGAVTVDECLAMAGGKTAALLGCSTSLGALLGGGRPAQVRGFEKAGRDLGLAFQLVDDLLGIWGDPAVTGKPVGADLARRKKSIPVVAALTSDTPAGTELAALYGIDRELTAPELARAAELVERTGARRWCRARIDELVEQAAERIVDIADGDPTDLLTLARRVAERES